MWKGHWQRPQWVKMGQRSGHSSVDANVGLGGRPRYESWIGHLLTVSKFLSLSAHFLVSKMIEKILKWLKSLCSCRGGVSVERKRGMYINVWHPTHIRLKALWLCMFIFLLDKTFWGIRQSLNKSEKLKRKVCLTGKEHREALGDRWGCGTVAAGAPHLFHILWPACCSLEASLWLWQNNSVVLCIARKLKAYGKEISRHSNDINFIGLLWGLKKVMDITRLTVLGMEYTFNKCMPILENRGYWHAESRNKNDEARPVSFATESCSA